MTIFPVILFSTIIIVTIFFFVNRNEEQKNHIKVNDFEITFDEEIDGETEQQLIVKAPETCVIGEMVTIDATASNCDSFEWKIIPETTDYRIIANKQEVLFTSRTAGKYIFIVAGTRDGILMPLKVITIIVEARTPLVPIIVDNAFTIKVKNWLPANADPIILEKLAKSFERVASAGHEEVTDLVKITALSNRGILGSQLEEYKPFLIAFSNHLKTNYVEATVDKHTELWFNLAAVLREIK